MCTLQFSVDGEFITDLSREWFYVEGKGYDKCMDLLESSMSGTNETKEQIIRHAEDLLLGRAALKGIQEMERTIWKFILLKKRRKCQNI